MYQDDVVHLYESLLDAWNRRDASAMSACYAPQGGQVGFDGSVANGPQQIEQHLRPIFIRRPTPRMVSKVREVRALGPNVVLLRAIAGMIPDGHSDIVPEGNSIHTLIASRTQLGRWMIELFQNTPATLDNKPEEREKLTQELREVAAA